MRKGFTLIELLICLAIIAIIFQIMAKVSDRPKLSVQIPCLSRVTILTDNRCGIILEETRQVEMEDKYYRVYNVRVRDNIGGYSTIEFYDCELKLILPTEQKEKK